MRKHKHPPINVSIEVWRAGDVEERGFLIGDEETGAEFCGAKEMDEKPLAVVHFKRHPDGMFPLAQTPST